MRFVRLWCILVFQSFLIILLVVMVWRLGHDAPGREPVSPPVERLIFLDDGGNVTEIRETIGAVSVDGLNTPSRFEGFHVFVRDDGGDVVLRRRDGLKLHITPGPGPVFTIQNRLGDRLSYESDQSGFRLVADMYGREWEQRGEFSPEKGESSPSYDLVSWLR